MTPDERFVTRKRIEFIDRRIAEIDATGKPSADELQERDKLFKERVTLAESLLDN